MAKVAKRLWKAGVMTWWYDMMTYDMMMGWRDDVMAWWRDDMMTWCHDVSLTWCHDDMTWWRDDTMTWSYILKVGVPGDRVSANFVHFPPKFRLGKQKPSRPHCNLGLDDGDDDIIDASSIIIIVKTDRLELPRGGGKLPLATPWRCNPIVFWNCDEDGGNDDDDDDGSSSEILMTMVILMMLVVFCFKVTWISSLEDLLSLWIGLER